MKIDIKTYFICVVLFALLLVSFCRPAQAETCKTNSLVINLSSLHYSTPSAEFGIREYNYKNYGLGWECLVIFGGQYGQPITFSAGFYDNSYYDTSVYLNAGLIINNVNSRTNLSLEIGAASGYSDLIRSSKLPSFTDDIIFYGGLGIKARITKYSAFKTLVLPDFVGFQYMRALVNDKPAINSGINFK